MPTNTNNGDLSSFLISAGTLLYGSRWKSDMCNLLGVSERTLRRWLDGNPPRDYHQIEARIIKEIYLRQISLTKLINGGES